MRAWDALSNEKEHGKQYGPADDRASDSPCEDGGSPSGTPGPVTGTRSAPFATDALVITYCCHTATLPIQESTSVVIESKVIKCQHCPGVVVD